MLYPSLGCVVLDLGSAWSTEKPAGSRYRFLRGLDSWLAWLHCFCILSVQVKKGESVFLMTQGHPAGQLPASAVSFQLPVSLGQERENDRSSHTYQRRVWRAVWKRKPVCPVRPKQLVWTVLGTVRRAGRWSQSKAVTGTCKSN